MVKIALKKAGFGEWIISIATAKNENFKSPVNVGGSSGEVLIIKVRIHQGSVLSPLFFIIAMDQLSKD